MSISRPQLFLPGDFRDPAGLTRLIGGSAFSLQGREEEIVGGILGGPQNVIAMTAAPSFDDQLHIFATHEEIAKYMLGSGLAELLELRPTTADDLIARVRELPFLPAMQYVASLQKAIAFGRTDKELQRRLMHDVYLDSEICAAGEKFLRANERAAIFSEQQLFALQRLLVLHASDENTDALTPDQQVALRMVLFFVPGVMLSPMEDELDSPPETLADERWLTYFVGNGGFAAHGSLAHEMARAHRMYEVIAKSRLVSDHHDFCPLDDWLLEKHHMTFVELQAFGFVVFAGSRLNFEDEPPLAVLPSYFDTTAFAGRTDDGFGAFCADREWFKTEFERTPETPRRAAFETNPFMRRPGLLRPDGSALILAPRAVQSWLGAGGAYYRFLDIAGDQGPDVWQRFSRFNGVLLERYVRQLMHVAYPYPEKRALIGGVGTVYGARPYRKRKQNEETTDVAIDLGTDLVLIEVTAGRLTDKSRVEGDAKAVKDDLQKMIGKKMGQLGRVIGDVFDEPSRLPEIDLEHVLTVWPVVVSGEGLFHNPTIWAYTDEHSGHHLRFEHDRVRATVKPVVLLDPEDLEILGAMVEAGLSITEILERKTYELWRERDFKAMVIEDFAHRWDEKPKFITAEQRRAFKSIRRAVDIVKP